MGIQFGCHACTPLISAAVFAKINHRWEIESQNRFLLYAGEYGKAPIAKFVMVKNQPGIELTAEYHGEGVTREKMLVVPVNNNIKFIKENEHAFTINITDLLNKSIVESDRLEFRLAGIKLSSYHVCICQ